MDYLAGKSVLIATTSGRLPFLKSVSTIEDLSYTLGSFLRRNGVDAKNLTISIPYFGSPLLNRMLGWSDHRLWQIPHYLNKTLSNSTSYEIVNNSFSGFLPKWLHREFRSHVYVTTIYDIIPIILSDNPVQNYELNLRRAVEADRIIVSSENTKEDLIKFLRVSDSKIDVIHLAVDNEFRPQIQELLAKRGQILINVGGPVRRKNKTFALEVFARLQTILPDASFIMVGYSQREVDKAVALGIIHKVKFLRNIAKKELIDIYQHADLMIYPSEYEGFGVPIIEAMRCGVPTIAQNNSCMSEIIGNSGIILDDYNVHDWVDRSLWLLTDEKAHRNKFNACIERGKGFSVDNYVAKNLQSYKLALEQHT